MSSSRFLAGLERWLPSRVSLEDRLRTLPPSREARIIRGDPGIVHQGHDAYTTILDGRTTSELLLDSEEACRMGTA